MLNLQELERKLDEALASETPESLTSWILGQRAKTPDVHTAETIHFSPIEENFVPQRSIQPKFITPDVSSAGLYNYAMAA